MFTLGTEPMVWLGGHWFTVIGILDPVPLQANLDSTAFIGYDLGTEIVNEAVKSARTIREVAIEKGVDEETLDKALDLQQMARGGTTAAR